MRYGRTRENCPGFTLVEVLITTSIIGLVSAVSLVSLSGFKVRREVEGSMRIVAAAIRDAQNNALTGKNIRGTTCVSGSDSVPCVPCGFEFSADGNAYVIHQSNASMDGSGSCSAFGGGTSVPLASGVSISSQSVAFSVPRAEPKTGSGSDLDSGFIDFVLSKGGVTAHVCVYPLGRVEERPMNAVGC